MDDIKLIDERDVRALMHHAFLCGWSSGRLDGADKSDTELSKANEVIDDFLADYHTTGYMCYGTTHGTCGAGWSQHLRDKLEIIRNKRLGVMTHCTDFDADPLFLAIDAVYEWMSPIVYDNLYGADVFDLSTGDCGLIRITFGTMVNLRVVACGVDISDSLPFKGKTLFEGVEQNVDDPTQIYDFLRKYFIAS